jgi:hypothetical protein
LTLTAALLPGLATTARANALTDELKKMIFGGSPSPTPQGAEPAHVRGAPLPAAPDAAPEKALQDNYREWLNRAIIAHAPADMDPKDAAFMKAVVNYWVTNHGYYTSNDLMAQAGAYDLQAVNDPALLVMINTLDSDPRRRMTGLDRALTLLPQSTYPKFIWFIVAANAGAAAHYLQASPAEQETRDQLSLKYLDEGLRDGSFQPGEMAALRWRFNAGSATDLMARKYQQVADIFDAAPEVAPWVKDYVDGVRYVHAAWAARGSGWANTVSKQGWDDFATNLASARDHLVKSWNANPHDPAAAATMIEVTMGQNEETDTMRSWFDRAVAADFEYMDAYKQLVWGLRPRWLGSYDEMNAFGRECAATMRYDTAVPYERVVIAMDISEDAEDHGTQFQDPRIAGEVLSVLDGYFATPNPPIPAAYAHTIAAIVAHKAGRMDEVRKHLAAIDYKPVMNRFLSGMDDLPALVTQARPAGTP